MATLASVLGDQLPGAGLVYASTARTATPTAVSFGVPQGAVGIALRIDVSAVAATPSVVFTIQGWDAAANEWFDILASAAVVATGTTLLRVDPRMAAAANLTAQSGLFPVMRLAPVHGDADSITYSVTAFVVA